MLRRASTPAAPRNPRAEIAAVRIEVILFADQRDRDADRCARGAALPRAWSPGHAALRAREARCGSGVDAVPPAHGGFRRLREAPADPDLGLSCRGSGFDPGDGAVADRYAGRAGSLVDFAAHCLARFWATPNLAGRLRHGPVRTRPQALGKGGRPGRPRISICRGPAKMKRSGSKNCLGISMMRCRVSTR